MRRGIAALASSLALVTLLSLVATVLPARASAATSLAGRGGVTISPAFQQITVTPDKADTSFDFSVTNNTALEQEFSLSVVDFGSLDETGGVLFVGKGEKALNYRYSLSPWVTLERDRIVVAPHSTDRVPVTIANKESLTPGGHYGAILVNPTDIADPAGRKVRIDQVASSLLFVKKVGGEVYKLDLKSFHVSPHIFSLPGTADVRFQNSGNVHVIPRGLATLTDPRGRVVKTGVVNADSGIALPETFRSFTVPLRSVGMSWLPGKYKLSISYRYDDVLATKTVETSFVYLNVFFLLFVVAILAFVVAIVVHKKLRQRVKNVVKSLLDKLQNLLPKRPKK